MPLAPAGRVRSMASHLGVAASITEPEPAAAAAASSVRTEQLLPGVSVSTYPTGGSAASEPPFDEMAACVAQAFSTYEPSLWGQGLQPGEDVCDTDQLEWNLQKTIRLMYNVEGATAYICRDDATGRLVSSVFLLENEAGGEPARPKGTAADKAAVGLTPEAQLQVMGADVVTRSSMFGVRLYTSK